MKYSDRAAWAILIGVELVYAVLTRWAADAWPLYSWQSELVRTPLRLLAALVLWLIFRDMLASPRLAPGAVLRPRLALALAIFFLVPLLAGFLGHDLPAQAAGIAGSLAAGLAEEIVFRGLVQNLLRRHLELWPSIAVTTGLFLAYHIGVVPPVFFAYAQAVPAGILLGIVFARTQNLWLVAGIHALYDILWEFTPLFSGPVIPYRYALALLCVAAALAAWWGWRPLRTAPALPTS